MSHLTTDIKLMHEQSHKEVDLWSLQNVKGKLVCKPIFPMLLIRRMSKADGIRVEVVTSPIQGSRNRILHLACHFETKLFFGFISSPPSPSTVLPILVGGQYRNTDLPSMFFAGSGPLKDSLSDRRYPRLKYSDIKLKG